MITGGPEGTRTPDLYSAIVALSQLSYRPEGRRYGSLAPIACQADRQRLYCLVLCSFTTLVSGVC
jgi:hypothetical protein